MELKLARTSLNATPKGITLEEIEENLEKKSIFYFDKDNSHKDLNTLKEVF